MLSPNGEAAMHIATELGWPVFPLAPGSKVPAIPREDGGHGHLDATTDPETIRAWWTERPRANIGISPGPARLMVVDVDPRHDREALRSGTARHS